jgi:hypothetical protein
VRVEVLGTVVGHPWANVFHVMTSAPGDVTEADVNELALAFHSAYNDAFLAAISTSNIVSGVVASYSNGDDTFVDGSEFNPAVGGDGGSVVSAAECFLLSWRVSATWRGGHPRTYIPGVMQDRLQDARTFTIATVSELQADAASFLAAVNLLTPSGFSSVTLGCLRRFAAGGSEATPKVYLDPPEFVPFSSVIMRSVPGIQRRRLAA